MPQASDELRAKMLEYFGDEIDDAGPWKYLKEQGYKEYKFVIYHPDILHVETEKETDCIDFLIDEWDWGFDPSLGTALEQQNGD